MFLLHTQHMHANLPKSKPYFIKWVHKFRTITDMWKARTISYHSSQFNVCPSVLFYFILWLKYHVQVSVSPLAYVEESKADSTVPCTEKFLNSINVLFMQHVKMLFEWWRKMIFFTTYLSCKKYRESFSSSFNCIKLVFKFIPYSMGRPSTIRTLQSSVEGEQQIMHVRDVI